MRKKKILLIILLIITFMPAVSTIARYVAKMTFNFIMEANNFYFSSDKLTVDNQIYQVNNWSGLDTFNIQFELNNKKNNLVFASTNISYEIQVNCSNDVICSINSNSGVIEVGENQDDFNISVTPTRAFAADEEVNVEITATSTSPYRKTLSGSFTIKVGRSGLSYQIDDKHNQPYLNMVITNARTGYRVDQAFGSYSVGQELSSSTYLELSDSDKAKCSSAIITLTFNPNVVVIDTTTNVINNSTLGYTRVGGINYISSLTFKVDSSSSTELRFYKKDVSQNYTYPYDNETSVINFNAV